MRRRCRLAWLSLFLTLAFALPATTEMDAQSFLQNYDLATPETRQIYGRILGSTENGMSWATAHFPTTTKFRFTVFLKSLRWPTNKSSAS